VADDALHEILHHGLHGLDLQPLADLDVVHDRAERVDRGPKAVISGLELFLERYVVIHRRRVSAALESGRFGKPRAIDGAWLLRGAETDALELLCQPGQQVPSRHERAGLRAFRRGRRGCSNVKTVSTLDRRSSRIPFQQMCQ